MPTGVLPRAQKILGTALTAKKAFVKTSKIKLHKSCSSSLCRGGFLSFCFLWLHFGLSVINISRCRIDKWFTKAQISVFASNISRPLCFITKGASLWGISHLQTCSAYISLPSFCDPLHLPGLNLQSGNQQTHLNVQIGGLGVFCVISLLFGSRPLQPVSDSLLLILVFASYLLSFNFNRGDMTLSFRSTRMPERTSTWHLMWNSTASKRSFWAECRVSGALWAQTHGT